ncbi:4-phosphoerythronate dehydrogenase [Bacteroidota bacterium]
MKLIVDENIPFGSEAFSSFGEVKLLNGRGITNQVCRDADVLIVRSITDVNEKLLTGTNIKFVGSATTGDDHMDKKYLEERNIYYYIAAGCNAYSVVEYVFAAVTYLAIKKGFSFEGKKLGIIGVGKIGSRIAKIAKALGFEIIMNDPPLQRETGSDEYRSLEEALTADIITCHVPLNKTGIDKTYHLIDKEILSMISSGKILINSSRGPVISNNALKKRIESKNDLTVVLDVWENEPGIDKELLKLIDIGSAHVAGYSLEGKVNGTTMVYNELCRFLNTASKWRPEYPSIENPNIKIELAESIEEVLQNIFSHTYRILDDDKALRTGLQKDINDWPKHFDYLRKNYTVRRELNNYIVKLINPKIKIAGEFNALRLNVV